MFSRLYIILYTLALALLLLATGTPTAFAANEQAHFSHPHASDFSDGPGPSIGCNLPSEGVFVPDLKQCPPLPRRTSPPRNVHDLRPDDFSVVMAVGDSITAAALAAGHQLIVAKSFSEWRGLSYAAGGDEGAITIPNFIKHYNSTVQGASIGKNLIPEMCLAGPLCSPNGWNSKVDKFNAARSGATAQNLLSEVRDYLIPQLEKHNVSDDAFKYLNFQVGSNDLCQLCLASEMPDAPLPGSPDAFEADVTEAVEYVRRHVPNTVVNMIGVFQVSGIYNITRRSPYCAVALPNIPYYGMLCACALNDGPVGDWVRHEMDKLQDMYNERMLRIVKRYQELNDSHFAVLWQPAVVPLGKYPLEGLSNVDCFHPSIATHQRIAAGVWNRLTLDAAGRSVEFGWTEEPLMRCLEESDRLQTRAVWED